MNIGEGLASLGVCGVATACIVYGYPIAAGVIAILGLLVIWG